MFDSHPDPDVGRVLKPPLDFVGLDGSRVRSNDLGLRERPFDLPPASYASCSSAIPT